MKQVLFHHPLPIREHATSASGIRPVRMIHAFRELGYDVDVVAGYAQDRQKAIAKIKQRLHEGTRYEFCYAESSTMPTTLTEPHHLPTHPFLDWQFFKLCNRHDIPIGLFYRDIYWRFSRYGRNLNALKVAVAKLAYRFDLWVYNRTLAALYLPSTAMGRYIPEVDSHLFAALPPGHNSPEVADNDLVTARPLRLFYVGGMSGHYQMHKLFRVVATLPDVELTVCTRQAEWENVRSEYSKLPSNIHIIHESGTRMESHLKRADIAVLYVKPQEYWEFAAPVKLYEYLGAEKPILASAGTLAGQFVRDNKIGWTIDYDESALRQLLFTLVDAPQEITDIKSNMGLVTHEHTWQARARQVASDLTR